MHCSTYPVYWISKAAWESWFIIHCSPPLIKRRSCHQHCSCLYKANQLGIVLASHTFSKKQFHCRFDDIIIIHIIFIFAECKRKTAWSGINSSDLNVPIYLWTRHMIKNWADLFGTSIADLKIYYHIMTMMSINSQMISSYSDAKLPYRFKWKSSQNIFHRAPEC